MNHDRIEAILALVLAVYAGHVVAGVPHDAGDRRALLMGVKLF